MVAQGSATTEPVVLPLLDWQFTIQSPSGILQTYDSTVCAALLPAMLRAQKLAIPGVVSKCLWDTLPEVQSVLSSFLRGRVSIVEVSAQAAPRMPLSAATSLFFSGGVDSFYSLLVEHEKVRNLILVHGFDVPYQREQEFRTREESVRRIAQNFKKPMAVVRTDLRDLPSPPPWSFWYGSAMAAVGHALGHLHGTLLVAASHAWEALYPWGSHPLLDPLWSSEAVQIVHHGANVRRIDKVKVISRSPEALSELRVCWESYGDVNCGRCEKCLRTMVALAAFGVLEKVRFAATLTPSAVRSIRLDFNAGMHWREMLSLDLPPRYRSAAEHILGNLRWELPPHDGTFRGEVRRGYYLTRQLLQLGKSFIS